MWFFVVASASTFFIVSRRYVRLGAGHLLERRCAGRCLCSLWIRHRRNLLVVGWPVDRLIRVCAQCPVVCPSGAMSFL